ncbi:hypothetical protein AJ80_05195 [Polytolypa hystricis UAMH7299]|uniref:Uncharacterized protein n=1 Tax=Polytolypa hystricis (strain UAMH7299) TaxID=1447883 RepID=A0A2B7Y5K3_POLH7|nr:hypothetical protein AJ80_05195 [Polytolypa hystricis UAMH7299]
MAGNSNVGTRSLHEDGDQRNSPREELRAERRNREHPPASSGRGSVHLREQQDRIHPRRLSDDDLSKIDPTAPAKMHGNKPSRGAVVDADLKREDEERLRQKGINK